MPTIGLKSHINRPDNENDRFDGSNQLVKRSNFRQFTVWCRASSGWDVIHCVQRIAGCYATGNGVPATAAPTLSRCSGLCLLCWRTREMPPAKGSAWVLLDIQCACRASACLLRTLEVCYAVPAERNEELIAHSLYYGIIFQWVGPFTAIQMTTARKPSGRRT
jgi:hypothetical protein